MAMYELVKGEEHVMNIEDGYVEEPIGFSKDDDFNRNVVGDYRKIDSSDVSRENCTSSNKRLVSLDVFRGLTVALMILVDHLGGLVPAINHSPWNGVTLADFVMPFFLFIVGVSLGLVYKNASSKKAATRKAILRTMKLLALGLFLQGGYFHGLGDLTFGLDIQQIRWMGILQRIAIAYLLTALCQIWLTGSDDIKSEYPLLSKCRYQWVFMFVLSTIYVALVYGLYVPDWEYLVPSNHLSDEVPARFSVKCGVRTDTGPACNAAGMIDRTILGFQHMYTRPIYARTKECSTNSPNYGPLPPNAPPWCQAPFEPEGILSTMMAVVTCCIGLQYGHIIRHLKDHRERILHWLVPSCGFVAIGLLLDLIGVHVNKALYTFSYTCLTTGVAGLSFIAIYVLVDLYGYRRPTKVLEWMGKHALAIFILAACNILPVLLQGFYWGKPENSILRLIGIKTESP